LKDSGTTTESHTASASFVSTHAADQGQIEK
jgi:hypothetical protein